MDIRKTPLRHSLMAASLIALSACAPYPMRYHSATSGGAAGPGLSDDCLKALGPADAKAGQDGNSAGARTHLTNCFVQRATAWENKARINRTATRGAGSLAIVSTAIGIALAAEGDPNHAIVPLGLASGAAVTGARSYASPEQGMVSEKAVAAYNCLLSAVAELQAGDNAGAVALAYGGLKRATADAKLPATPSAAMGLGAGDGRSVSAVAAADAASIRAAKAGQKNAVQAQLEILAGEIETTAAGAAASVATVEAARKAIAEASLHADIAKQQFDVQTRLADTRLLKQSDLIDNVAVDQINKHEPTVYAVASSAHDSIQDVASRLNLPASTPDAKPKATGGKMALAVPLTAEQVCGSGRLAGACSRLQRWRAFARDAAQDAKDAAATVAEVQGAAQVFDAAVAASKAADPQLGQTCIVAVTEIPPLAVSPAKLTLSDQRTGTIYLSGGVTGYYPEAPPKGWTVTVTPSGRADIAAPDSAKNEVLSFYDGSAVRSHVSVEVSMPAAKTDAGAGGADSGGGAQTTTPPGGPNGAAPPPVPTH
ncbi:MAG: hypothetical protein JF588_04120 [Caulobacterales bacterium]|nr:hypothetical protein [Caulobacterales bacterium]